MKRFTSPRHTFGNALRAMRLGWYECPALDLMIRMSTVGDAGNIVEVCPIGKVPSTAATGQARVWTEGDDDGGDILEFLPWLKELGDVDRHLIFRVDNNGAVVLRSEGKNR